MLNLMPTPHVLQMNEIFPTIRSTDDSGRRMITGGRDVRGSQVGGNDISAKNHTKTKSTGVQYQAECCYEQEDSSQA